MSFERIKKNHQNGVTLIELIITLTVLAVIAGFLGRPLISLIETKLLIDGQTDQQADIEYALSRISNEIRFVSEGDACPTVSRVEVGSGNGVVEYRYEVENLVVATKDPVKTEVLVSNINAFDCTKPSNKTPNLYELILLSDGDTYIVRGLQRQ